MTDDNLTHTTDDKTRLLNDQYYKDLIDKDLFELMGFKNLSEEKKKELAQIALDTIEQRVFARILDQLSEADRDELYKLFDQNYFDKATDFINERKIDTQKIFAEEVFIYKNEMVQNAQMIKKNLDTNQANSKE